MDILRKAYLVLFPGIILLVIIQTFARIIPDKKLIGEEIPVKAPALNLSNILSARFQQDCDAYLSSKIGFRGYCIKSDNQINFSLFREFSSKFATRMVLCGNNSIFDFDYIGTFNKQDTVPVGALEERVRRMKQLQDLLAARGIMFLFIITPSKTSIYPEYIPDRYRLERRESIKSNYENILPLLTRYGIRYFDGRVFLTNLKARLDYPIFPKSGIHWSIYAQFFLLERLWETIQRDSPWNLPAVRMSSVTVTDSPRYPDNDLTLLANLFCDRSLYESSYKYPVFLSDPRPDRFRPRVLGVGGSFLKNLFYFGTDPAGLCREQDFYYYYQSQSRIPDIGTKPICKDPACLRKAILDHDLILVEANEQTLKIVGFGFLDDAVKALSH